MSDSNKGFSRYLKRFGAGSMLVSIIVHVIIIGAATVWVVSTVHPQRKAAFKGGESSSSPVQHPVKMSNTQPHLDTLTKRLSVDTPNAAVALPDLPTPDSGMGKPSLNAKFDPGGAGIGNLKSPIMPMFGFKDAQTGGTLVGNFYDFKQLRGPKPNPEYKGDIDARLDGPSGDFDILQIQKFVKTQWSRSSLDRYYRSPNPLYATQIFIPYMEASEAPKAYGVENLVKSKAWIALYRGKVSPPKDGVYRFVGAADDVILVKLDGKLVLDGSMAPNVTDTKTDRPKRPLYGGVEGTWVSKIVVGKRLELKANQFYDINILISEAPGGNFAAFLMFEQEGVKYPTKPNGDPILPIFRVADAKTDLKGQFPAFLPNGPVWRALPPPKD